ncbi:hypothetical protein [Rhodopirellula sp. SWK7]|uniref:hypothetical protein n=1 Tax=Rhodopirellula sp. SWK7 TaxID=595460 RepID=UPI0005C60A0E|nr:hypothetical protein [Rhodopirellula sp. SWK7]
MNDSPVEPRFDGTVTVADLNDTDLAAIAIIQESKRNYRDIGLAAGDLTSEFMEAAQKLVLCGILEAKIGCVVENELATVSYQFQVGGQWGAPAAQFINQMHNKPDRPRSVLIVDPHFSQVALTGWGERAKAAIANGSASFVAHWWQQDPAWINAKVCFRVIGRTSATRQPTSMNVAAAQANANVVVNLDEGIDRLATLLAGEEQKTKPTENDEYPWPNDLGRDLTIWQNIREIGGNELEILLEQQKKGSGVGDKRQKQLALRWAVFNGYTHTRNFEGEREILPAERKKVLDQIAAKRKRNP